MTFMLSVNYQNKLYIFTYGWSFIAAGICSVNKRHLFYSRMLRRQFTAPEKCFDRAVYLPHYSDERDCGNSTQH